MSSPRTRKSGPALTCRPRLLRRARSREMAAPRRGLSLSSADAFMGVLHEQHPRLRALMDTWVHLYGAAHSHGLPSVAEVTRAMDAVGLLDFERLSKRPRWLSERGYWPDGRPSRTAPPTWAWTHPAPPDKASRKPSSRERGQCGRSSGPTRGMPCPAAA